MAVEATKLKTFSGKQYSLREVAWKKPYAEKIARGYETIGCLTRVVKVKRQTKPIGGQLFNPGNYAVYIHCKR